jgi:ABC-type Zn uptake system ZnuABC Zn-binding protein ZnuA
MNVRSFMATVLILLPGALLVSGCKSRDATAPKTGEKPVVTCTTTMIADLARNVGGGRIQVYCIMPPATDPHIYEPKPDDVMLFRKSDLILYNGLHLEGKMVQMIENAGAKAVALAEDSRIKPRESIGAAGAPDPHCWWDARHFIVYAERARDALIRIDPNGAADYRARTDAYVKALADVDSEVRAQIERIPPARRFLVTSHDAFFYYGAAYGLKVDAVLGISTDASVRALRPDELARLVVQNRVPAIFHETSVSDSLNRMVDRVVELAAREGHQVRIPRAALYSDSLGVPGSAAESYIGALRENTRIIVEALRSTDADSQLNGGAATTQTAVGGAQK